MEVFEQFVSFMYGLSMITIVISVICVFAFTMSEYLSDDRLEEDNKGEREDI